MARARLRAGERGRRERKVSASGAFARMPLRPPPDEPVTSFFLENDHGAEEPLLTEVVSRARAQLPLQTAAPAGGEEIRRPWMFASGGRLA